MCVREVATSYWKIHKQSDCGKEQSYSNSQDHNCQDRAERGPDIEKAQCVHEERVSVGLQQRVLHRGFRDCPGDGPKGIVWF